MRRILLVLIPFVLASGPALAQHPFNVRDLIAMDRVSSPAVSPDGRLVVFVVSGLDLRARGADRAPGRVNDRVFVRPWDPGADGRRSHVFVVPVDGGAAVDLMSG